MHAFGEGGREIPFLQKERARGTPALTSLCYLVSAVEVLPPLCIQEGGRIILPPRQNPWVWLVASIRPATWVQAAPTKSRAIEIPVLWKRPVGKLSGDGAIPPPTDWARSAFHGAALPCCLFCFHLACIHMNKLSQSNAKLARIWALMSVRSQLCVQAGRLERGQRRVPWGQAMVDSCPSWFHTDSSSSCPRKNYSIVKGTWLGC